jgi:tRNA(Ile)-lysidine synthase
MEDYTRNHIRLQLLPLLERDYNPRVRESLLRLAEIAAQTNDVLNKQADALLLGALRTIPGGVELDLEKLRVFHAAVLRQMFVRLWQQQAWPLQDMSFEKWEQLVEWATVAPPKETGPRAELMPGGIRLVREASALRLTRAVAAR